MPARKVYRLTPPAVVLGAWVRVPTWAVDMAHVRGNLTLRNPEYWSAVEMDESTEGMEPFILLYRERGAYVYLPRHFKLQLTQKLPIRRLPMPAPAVKNLTATVKPRNDIQVKAMAAFSGDEDGILQLSAGTGKTITSLMIASEGKKFPLLIVVHTTALFAQWKKVISQVYAIPESEIGTIRGPKCEWRGKSVAIAMLPSLAQRKYEPEFYKHWRLIVVDEVHRAGAISWAKTVYLFHGQRIGLSATPDRPDGMDKAFRVHLGKVRYRYTQQPLGSEFVFVHTGRTIPTPWMRNPMKRLAVVMSNCSKDIVRNDCISAILRQVHKEGRKVIVLGDRVETLELLCKKYPGKSKAVFVGKVKQGADREAALSKDAIFATSSMAKEGLDVPALDTLLITIPFSGLGRLEQSVGRILRTCEGKQQPRTYVFVDKQPSLQKFAATQRNWADMKGYPIRDLFPGEY